jgi:hypothetical protein
LDGGAVHYTGGLIIVVSDRSAVQRMGSIPTATLSIIVTEFEHEHEHEER